MSYITDILAKIGHDPVILVAVCAIIASGDKILLQKRQDNEKWGLPGGLMELAENAETTLRREIGEELGVTTVTPKFFGVYQCQGVNVKVSP